MLCQLQYHEKPWHGAERSDVSRKRSMKKNIPTRYDMIGPSQATRDRIVALRICCKDVRFGNLHLTVYRASRSRSARRLGTSFRLQR